jgi:hypothetical protein
MRNALASIKSGTVGGMRLFGALVAFLVAPIGFREVMLFGGAGLIGVGAGMVYVPAGLILAGVLIAGVAVFGVR